MIQSIQRATKILSLFSLQRPYLGISEISQLTKLNKGTVQGLIRTLVQEGLLQQNHESRKYQLGLNLYELGTVAVGCLEIVQRASAPAQDLAIRSDHNVRVAVYDKDSAMVVLGAYSKSQGFFFRQLGPRAPLHCSSLGKAILAFLEPTELDRCLQKINFVPFTANTITDRERLLRNLDEIRRLGYSVNREERLFGRAAIGAPIFGRNKRPVASICIAGHPKDIFGEKMENMIMEVRHTALEISFQMGYSI